MQTFVFLEWPLKSMIQTNLGVFASLLLTQEVEIYNHFSFMFPQRSNF